ncbi:MAG: 4Fe-4S dicluster domain-containing protein [Desulfobacterales bacterium]|nr:4Fe-4S dicluster domain-containing protein [Desulfobacterales bacterium]
MFAVSFYIASVICLLGVFWKVLNWYRLRIGDDSRRFSFISRLYSFFCEFFSTLFSARLILALQAFFFDAVLQTKVFKTDFVRWLMHACIFWGFLMLLLMHALDDFITAPLFGDYASTLNPYFFLRNFFGFMVLFGIGIAIYRRTKIKDLKSITNKFDKFAIALILVIIFSGFLAESLQIISEPVFDQMVADYMGGDDEETVNNLKVFWQEEFGVVFKNIDEGSDIEAGQSVHEESCISCHSVPSSAFISYPLSKILKPIGNFLNLIRADLILWYIHFLACFIGLAYIPFSKFFHIISTPLNFMLKGMDEFDFSGLPKDEINHPSKVLIGLDACTHCGMCTLHCSVSSIFKVMPNSNILPSEKINGVKAITSNMRMSESELNDVSEGSFICTGCYRCTTLCPSGINLQEIWALSKQDLINAGFPEPHVWIPKISSSKWAEKLQGIKDDDEDIFSYYLLTEKSETFAPCVQCSICTSVCPVVEAANKGYIDLDFTPQQVMNLLRMELKNIAIGSKMVWNCLTCYMCQEHCPQGIKVADVLYELRNIGYERLTPLRIKGDNLKKLA